jgi:hypothetical protein
MESTQVTCHSPSSTIQRLLKHSMNGLYLLLGILFNSFPPLRYSKKPGNVVGRNSFIPIVFMIQGPIRSVWMHSVELWNSVAVKR